MVEQSFFALRPFARNILCGDFSGAGAFDKLDRKMMIVKEDDGG